MAKTSENYSLIIFTEGSTLKVQKIKNGEKSFVKLPPKIYSCSDPNSNARYTFIDRLVYYAFGKNTESVSVSIDFSHDAKELLYSSFAICSD